MPLRPASAKNAADRPGTSWSSRERSQRHKNRSGCSRWLVLVGSVLVEIFMALSRAHDVAGPPWLGSVFMAQSAKIVQDGSSWSVLAEVFMAPSRFHDVAGPSWLGSSKVVQDGSSWSVLVEVFMTPSANIALGCSSWSVLVMMQLVRLGRHLHDTTCKKSFRVARPGPSPPRAHDVAGPSWLRSSKIVQDGSSWSALVMMVAGPPWSRSS